MGPGVSKRRQHENMCALLSSRVGGNPITAISRYHQNALRFSQSPDVQNQNIPYQYAWDLCVRNLRSSLRHYSASGITYKVRTTLSSFLPSYLHVLQNSGSDLQKHRKPSEWPFLLLSCVALTAQMRSSSNTKNSASPDDVLRSPRHYQNPTWELCASRVSDLPRNELLAYGVPYKVPSRLSFCPFSYIHVLQNVGSELQIPSLEMHVRFSPSSVQHHLCSSDLFNSPKKIQDLTMFCWVQKNNR